MKKFMLQPILFGGIVAAHSITADVPVLVRATNAANEYIYFPQTLHWAGKDTLILSSQSDSDALHDAGWTGFSMGSINAGKSWSNIPPASDFPWLFKPCVTQQSDGGVDDIMCFEYPLRRPQAGFGNHTRALLRAQKFHGLEATGTANVTLDFPPSIALEEWGAHTYLMVTDGSVIPLKDGGLLMLLYGNLLTDGKSSEKYSIVAVKSVTNGMSWTYLSTVARGSSEGCGAPSEHDCVRLSNQSIYCVWRNEGSLCSAESHDEGVTWSTPTPLRSPDGSPPFKNNPNYNIGSTSPPITPQCSHVLNSFCSNVTANQRCIHATESWYGDATLPMFGLYDKSCAHERCKGHNCTCTGLGPEGWRCYSHLSLNATLNGWSNASLHPNAYCSECGATLAKLYSECMGQPWPPLPSIPWGVEPKIVKLPLSGRLVISTGRPGLFVWVANDPPEDGWTPFNLAAHHNAVYNDSKWHFGSIVPGTSETTSYTGMVAVPGTDDVIVSYDWLANGWSPAPWPSEASGIFVVRVSFG